MDDEKDFYFKLLIAVCSITVIVEIGLLIWSNIQVGKIDLNNTSVVAIELAAKGVMSFFTLLLGSWITTSISIFIPQIKVSNLYYKTDGHEKHTIATAFYVAFWIVPVANTLCSICGSFLLIKEAGVSLYDMIGVLL